MLLDILKAIHAYFGTCALCTGIATTFRIVSGGPFGFWAGRFLTYSLGAAAAGILISLDDPDPMRWLAVLGVYVTAIAVLAWRRRESADNWTDLFVLSTMAVVCLDSFIFIAHLFRLAALLNGTPSGPTPPLIVAGAILVFFFAVLSAIGLKSVHQASNRRFSQ